MQSFEQNDGVRDDGETSHSVKNPTAQQQALQPGAQQAKINLEVGVPDELLQAFPQQRVL